MAVCELSASGSAFGTFLSAFIGSILNGLFNGFYIAFFTGWIAWLSVTRILAAGLYEAYLATKPLDQDGGYESIHLQPLAASADDTEYHGATSAPAPAYLASNYGPNASEQQQQQQQQQQQPYDALPPPPSYDESTKPQPDSSSSNINPSADQGPGAAARVQPPHRLAPRRDVDWKGWLGWAWGSLYTPASQTVWFTVNISNPLNPAVKIVRAVAIGVSALGLTFDTRRRYAAALARRTGMPWLGIAFNAWNSLACLLLGAEALALLVQGAAQLARAGDVPAFLPFVYAFFSAVWALVSWRVLPPVDGSRPGAGLLADVLMGAFAGIFCAAPALVLWRSSVFDERAAEMMGAGRVKPPPAPGLDLGAYLQCEGAGLLGKLAAVMP